MTKALYPSFSVLLVDDRVSSLRHMSLMLERSARINNLLHCRDSRDLMEILAGENVGLVLLSMTMSNPSGDKLLPLIIENHPAVEVIMINGPNRVETAIECIKNGAFDYQFKPVATDRLAKSVVRAIEALETKREKRKAHQRSRADELGRREALYDIVTRNKTMRSIFQYMKAIAHSNQPILITGESGVGKELFARAAHKLSGCRGPLISVNVAGLDDNVFADTLFGHSRGAFTGAESFRSGMIEQAANGTLFLDEIGDLSCESQVKLLRLLQEGEYLPLGSDKPKRLQARIVIATHHDLAAKYAAGTFRKDLYYRLRTHHVHIPQLRERKEDIPLLLQHFLKTAAADLGKKVPTVPKELLVLLANYPFPGNIRELKAMVYDAMSVHQDMMLSMKLFKRAMDENLGKVAEPAEECLSEENAFARIERLPALHEVGDLLIAEAMKRAEGNQSIACRLLGISQPALSKRLKKSGGKIKER